MTRYVYPARCIDITDGDTIRVVLDRGWRDWSERRVRLLRVDTPEMRGPEKAEGIVARDFVKAWLRQAARVDDDWPLDVWSMELDSFGRILGEVTRRSDGANLNDALIAKGWAAA